MSENKTAYSGKDYPVHSSGPWAVTAGIAPDHNGRLIVEDCSGNPVCEYGFLPSLSGLRIARITWVPTCHSVAVMEANAKLIAAAPEMLEVLRWLDAEMDCRDDDFGGVMFSRGDFEKVRRAIKLAMEG